MAVHWLIESDVFPESAPRVIKALDDAGIPWTRYADDLETPPSIPADSKVVFWGSLGAAYAERVAARWTPGAIGDITRFFCSRYFPELREYLANADSVFTTVSALVDNPRDVTSPLSGSRFLVRPDSPLKPFSGRVLDIDALTLKALDHGFYYDDHDLPILVSSCKSVEREWRFIIVARAVVSSSGYEESRQGERSAPPGEAIALAEKVAQLPWQAADAYIVDIGEVDGAIRVLELNPFSGADFYLCDASRIVGAIAQLLQA